MEFSAQQIAGFLNGTVEENLNVKVSNFSKIEEGKSGTLIFLTNLKYAYHIYNTKTSIVLVSNDLELEQPIRVAPVKIESTYTALTMLLSLVEQSRGKEKGIDSTVFIAASATVSDNRYIGNFAYIGEGVKMDGNCMVYPHAYIGDHVTVGDNCVFYSHAAVYGNCITGNNCTPHAGSAAGIDGFRFAPEGRTYKKIPQLGNVVIEDDVRIGTDTTIDRAVVDSTVIRRGVKLDGLVQTAHNVEVGENTVMAVQVGIVGSVKTGKRCMFDGQIGLAGHIHVADHVVPGVQIDVISDMKEAMTLLGAPAINVKNFMRSSAISNRLPDIYRSLRQMQWEIEQLKKEINRQ